MAEWSKAPALGAGPKGRGFEPHCCQILSYLRCTHDVRKKSDEQTIEGACGVVVSRLLCMQKASGSNPDKSIFRVLVPHNFSAGYLILIHFSKRRWSSG